MSPTSRDAAPPARPGTAVPRTGIARPGRPDRPAAGGPPEHWDALVVGGGIAGLTAAWELTRAGLRPMLVEARGYTGGLVAAGTIGGVRMDLGAEGFAVRGRAVTSMVDALGLRVAGPKGGGARLFLPPRPDEARSTADPSRGWRLHRFIRDAFLGIPAHPLADDVVAVIGRRAAERAARDADMAGEVGTRPDDPADLASFVRTRMGEGVLDRLTGPIVAGIHSSDPAVLAADALAPGLREDTARLGSLQAAIGRILERRRGRGRGKADATTAGGLTRLTDALRSAVEAAGGAVLTRTGAQWLRPVGRSGASSGSDDASDGAPLWEAALAPTGPGPTPSAEPVPVGPARLVRAPRVVLACSAPAALRLLDGAGAIGEPAMPIPVGSPIARFTLVVRSPALAGAPVGSGLLVADAGAASDCPVGAKDLSHLSGKWPWIGADLTALHGPDAHALRLSYGRPGRPRPDVDLDLALADARILTGVRIDPADVIDSALVRWDGTLPPATPEHRERVRRLRSRVAELPGLALTGAWVAGTGIAAVVEDARRQAVIASVCGTSSLPVTAAPTHHKERP